MDSLESWTENEAPHRSVAAQGNQIRGVNHAGLYLIGAKDYMSHQDTSPARTRLAARA